MTYTMEWAEIQENLGDLQEAWAERKGGACERADLAFASHCPCAQARRLAHRPLQLSAPDAGRPLLPRDLLLCSPFQMDIYPFHKPDPKESPWSPPKQSPSLVGNTQFLMKPFLLPCSGYHLSQASVTVGIDPREYLTSVLLSNSNLLTSPPR